MEKGNTMDRLFRFVKGMFIGSGFILPGVSGGALAAVFGIYERMIAFLSNFTKEFKKNVLFFLPVGIGGVIGIFLLSFPISFFLENYETQVLWFFIGCILGTLPALWKQANKQGRTSKHLWILVITMVLGYLFLLFGEKGIKADLPQTFFTWIIAGAIIGLGAIVPGLSPSNFLVYLNLYQPMTDGIKTLDISVILPILVGVAVVVIGLSKLMNYLFGVAYTGIYHFILGIVIASTLMIVPQQYNYASIGALFCLALCVLGSALGFWMTKLEDKYKPEN